MDKLYCFFFVLLLHTALIGQALFNNKGADIFVKDGGFLVVKTNSLYNTQISGLGYIDNLGTIVVEGNITNDGSIVANSDTIKLAGDWINNGSYTGNSSWVEMYGGAQQITGATVTTFSNLSLLGGNVVKRQTLDAVTSGLLSLNDAELATDVNEMHVTNPGANAISRNNGFVSSVAGGKLSRTTNSAGAYFFPTGSPSYINPPSLFRPVELSPSFSSTNIYGAMLIKGDATNDGYNVNSLDDILCKINPNFYHKLYHRSGNDASFIKMFFNPVTDGTWSEEAHWDSPNRWNYLGSSSGGTGLGLSTVTVSGVSDFSPEPFALASKKFTVDAGPNVDIVQGQSTTFNPLIGTNIISSVDWSPPYALNCGNCKTPTANPAVTTYYTIMVTDGAGCAAYDSLLVNVTSYELLIPTAFSPNGDGVNDLFRVLNKEIDKLNLRIYNRWGEKVFETNDPQEGWDGFYKNVEQEMGVYVWECDYMFYGYGKSRAAKGNVTLMR